MKLNEIHIRDPYILAYEGCYYMYGTPMADYCGEINGFWCTSSKDMVEWSEPVRCFTPPVDFWGTRDFWAPEVHFYKGAFYMFATFIADGYMRAVQIMRSSKPEGPYEVWSSPVTPANHMCLDGTLYLEDDIPYMVYCHEWLQIGTGEICMIPLKEDLSGASGQPVTLFKASDAEWVDPVIERLINDKKAMVTDGPFLFKENGTLYMIWSSFHNGKYAMGYAESVSGRLEGPWKQHEDLLIGEDGGHGMIFETFDGKRLLTLHQPNFAPMERPVLLALQVTDGKISVKRTI